MNHTKISKILLVLFAVVLCFGLVGLAGPIGTAFTYQGRLIDSNEAADGLYDFKFKLFDANTGTNKLGPDVNESEVDVIDGYFTVELNFGSVFDGDDRWLEIGVRPGEQNDPNVYTVLSPRQEITPTPYALHIRGILVDNANTFVGLGAGAVTTGICNTFLGWGAGYSNTTGSFNTFSGNIAGYSNTTGIGNTFSGDYAGYSNTTGSSNTFSGESAAPPIPQVMATHSQDTLQATPTPQGMTTHSQDTGQATPTPQGMTTHSRESARADTIPQAVRTHSQDTLQDTPTPQVVSTHSQET